VLEGRNKAQMLAFLPHQQHHGIKARDKIFGKRTPLRFTSLPRHTKDTMRITECWHPNLNEQQDYIALLLPPEV